MRFEWDYDKAEANLEKHGVAFDEAVTVFYDPLAATFDDPDHGHSERRLINDRQLLARPPAGCVPHRTRRHDTLDQRSSRDAA